MELGLGAGAFWDAIEAMGGRRLQPGAAVDALSEAIDVIRGIWDAGSREPLRVGGEHYHVQGAKRGPLPAHRIAIWVGANRPRMLRLIGRQADGWLPSRGRLPSTAALGEGNAVIDEAAVRAGRDPAAVRRLLNVSGRFGPGDGPLTGSATDWAERLAELTVTYGVTAYILESDDPGDIARFGEQVAPGRAPAGGDRGETR